MTRHAFLFDLNRCTGCQACAIACGTENYPGRFGAGALNWRQVLIANEERAPGWPSYALSLACNHCEEPACASACPAGAYEQDAATGAVLVHGDRCIGCRYCTWACPYDAPRFSPRTRTIEKCTFCNHRLTAGLAPACVTACPTDALKIGAPDGNGPARALEVPGFVATPLNPSIRFVPLRSAAVHVSLEPPAPSAPAASWAAVGPAGSGHSGISLKDEWPLLLFTSLGLVLVSLHAGERLGAHWLGAWWPSFFTLTGALALFASTVHLGRPERAWRAVLNLRTSWLSREVLLVPLFLAGGAALFVYARRLSWTERELLRGAVSAVGLLALFCADRVYSVIRPPGGERHAPGRGFPLLAGALWLAGAASGNSWIWEPAAALRMAVTVRSGLFGRDRWLVARLALGFFAPITMLILLALNDGRPRHAVVVAFLLALTGELIERVRFYRGLSVTTPRAEMQRARASVEPDA